MADLNERDTKLIQYLSEAYGKERELETALEAHIAMTTKAPYKKRLKQHLRETKAHARQSTDGSRSSGRRAEGTDVVGKAMAAAKGPLHGPRQRRAGEDAEERQDRVLQRARGDRHLPGDRDLAEKVGDRETAKLAKGIRREEERMAKFLAGQIKSLTGAVVTEEIPAAQRKAASGSRKRKRPAAKRTVKTR